MSPREVDNHRATPSSPDYGSFPRVVERLGELVRDKQY